MFSRTRPKRRGVRQWRSRGLLHRAGHLRGHSENAFRAERQQAEAWYRTAYHSGTIGVVSKQIAVRLPDDVVEFIDREVDQRHVPSRAAFVLKALERERRRLIAARDAEILANPTANDSELDALASHVTDFDMDID